MEFLADSVISNSIFGEVVGAYFLAPVAGADLFIACGAECFCFFLYLDLVEFRAQHGEGFFAVCVLGAFGAGGDDDPRGFVEDPHGGFHLVHVLPAGAARAGERDLKIAVVYLYLFCVWYI